MVGTVMLALTAAPAVATAAAPQWSGLDARDYGGPIGAPGTLIESVPLDPALSVAGAGQAFRILYSTVDQHDRPAVSTAVVFTPKSAPPPGGWPVVAWAHGTVGLGDDCTPSARPRSERDNEYLSHWLDQGYVVVGSDYAGLGTPGLMSYLNSRTTARGVVDSVIATHGLDLPLSPKWAVVGQSQGGAAAVATARWATEFSAGTGLDYRGVVATGTPAGVESLVKKAGPEMEVPASLGPVANAYTAYIVAALREAHPELDLDVILTPAGRAAADRAETLCLADLSATLTDMTVPGFFTAPLTSIPGSPEVVDAYMGIPADGYDRPIFLGVGLLDRDVPPELTLRFADALTAHGQDVTLKVYPDEDHSGTVLASLPDSTPFLAGLLS
ncbi:lipase [Mycolicibacterium phlei DSM 43072]|uniref:Lipase n=1 Tax=Mycolicibacterium phlei DSM 43239 = CCUG 21000 TaxID=1226750 RepID=A0A5N5V951_MYCPH|nr:lipase [Mycolicibacterium phlei DSM 43239 = CCUG 21000]KXW66962.1 lipase [Mycolicibacterium phlei DSM 43239 = CCUG 21000]KXW70578.1 lipase [Mycolicibacterium phlei DSM 43072]KXW73994.1 lipase [Mycolicibacterium phlei DSM 43070]